MNGLLVLTLTATVACVAAQPRREVCQSGGRTYNYKQKWTALGGKATCKCEYPYYAGRRGDSVRPLCKWEGCKLTDGAFYRPGERLVRDGVGCMCSPGSDPLLQDAYVLYHFKCTREYYHISIEVSAPQPVETAPQLMGAPPSKSEVKACSHGGRTYSYRQRWRTLDGKQRCECDYQWYAGQRGRTVEAVCHHEGCKIYNGEFYRPGQMITREDRVTCRCILGTDPLLADATTLYHFECNEKGYNVPVEP